MKMFEEVKWYEKGYVFEHYARIVENFKDYEKISRIKMLQEIYQVYDNPDNIIDICTTRELKFLKLVLEHRAPEEVKISDILENSKHVEDKYEWEKHTLMDKFLLAYKSEIPEEIVEKVKQAVAKVNWREKKQEDNLIELLVGYCKIQGIVPLHIVCQVANLIANIKEDAISEYLLNSKLFHYYVSIFLQKVGDLDKEIPYALHEDYYYIKDELEEERKKQGIAGTKTVNVKMFKTMFYNDFDINNPKIKKFLTELKSLPFFWNSAIEIIRKYAMLNIDRAPLKETISSVPSLQYIDLTNFFKILDEAMDEMPSGALNGFTPNELKEIQAKNVLLQMNKAKKYVKQGNACLAKKDAKLFYKILLGLLEFTNQKYKIKEHIKIYNQTNIDPYEIYDVVDKYWENKELVTDEFCLKNPYKFSEEELKIASEFKKGLRSVFVIARYELEYTGFVEVDKVYMVKGLNCNLDDIIPYNELPHVAITSIIPFKGNLVYDGMLFGLAVDLGTSFAETLEKEYDSMMKYYHL